jgi:hypothetical protein
MIIEWIFTFIVFYFLYKLVFDFIIPVYRASSQIRNKVNEMNQQYNQTQRPSENQSTSANTNRRPPSEDYIDFEEIK